MIVTEYYTTREDGVRLFRTYSDEDFMILQDATQTLYVEAIDVEDGGNTYTETDIPISEDIPDGTALRILLGGDMDETV